MLNKIELVEEEETSLFPCNEMQCWEAIDTFNYDYTIIHSNYVAVIASPDGCRVTCCCSTREMLYS